MSLVGRCHDIGGRRQRYQGGAPRISRAITIKQRYSRHRMAKLCLYYTPHRWPYDVCEKRRRNVLYIVGIGGYME